MVVAHKISTAHLPLILLVLPLGDDVAVVRGEQHSLSLQLALGVIQLCLQTQHLHARVYAVLRFLFPSHPLPPHAHLDRREKG